MTNKEAIEVFENPSKHIKLINGQIYYSQFFVEAMEMAIKVLEQEPKGYWIEVDTNMYTCSNCSHCFSIVPEDNSIKQYHYCPNCKTRMVEPHNDPVERGGDNGKE